MAGFLFWKKKKSKDEVADPIESAVETAVESAVEPAIEVVAQTEPVAEPKPREKVIPAAQPKPAAPAPKKVAVEAVELPKRSLAKGVRSLFARIKFDPENLDDLEDILIQGDFGVDASLAIVTEVKDRAKLTGAKTEQELKEILVAVLVDQLERSDKELKLDGKKFPYVFLVVGVNGVGKTTTIGKLAKWLTDGEWNVVIGAADTFRAAAVDQIATWADRASAVLVRPKTEGQDPASVAFEAVELGIKTDADIVIIDTAGRLQNKTDLMDELGKIRRVVEKQTPITEVLLVLDATTGQNGLAQAKAFAEIANVTGVVLTKLDGTARGGIVFAIQQQLGIPVKLVGVGEGINDFAFFDATEFSRGLVA